MAEWHRNNNREYIRMIVDSDFKFKIEGKDQLYTGKCKNLSHTGFQFQSTELIPKGSVIKGSIQSGNSNFSPLSAILKVNRIENLEDGEYLIACSIKKLK